MVSFSNVKHSETEPKKKNQKWKTVYFIVNVLFLTVVASELLSTTQPHNAVGVFSHIPFISVLVAACIEDAILWQIHINTLYG